VGIILWELLAGQRLFLGDSDFQTVKKVQAAVIPSISQLNKSVPDELDRIIQRALARDPGKRYATARSLGRDLSKFMFKYGVPVSTFDIAALVQGTMRDRQRHRPQQPSIIDKLIEEALLEFTSLTDKDAPATDANTMHLPVPAGVSKHPLGAGRSWIDEIGVGTNRNDALQAAAAQRHQALTASLPAGLSEGNLAALEDEHPSRPSSPSPGSSRPVWPSAPRSSGSRAPMPAADSEPSLVEKTSGVATKIGVVVALAVVIAAGAAAWFTHLIPHP
jgi:serine/threonine protein kinase